jgi:hypothetical protein
MWHGILGRAARFVCVRAASLLPAIKSKPLTQPGTEEPGVRFAFVGGGIADGPKVTSTRETQKKP